MVPNFRDGKTITLNFSSERATFPEKEVDHGYFEPYEQRRFGSIISTKLSECNCYLLQIFVSVSFLDKLASCKYLNPVSFAAASGIYRKMAIDSELVQRMNALKGKIALLREKTIQEKIAFFRKDNETLKQEVNLLKKQYEDALVSNGRSVSLLINAVPNKSAAVEMNVKKPEAEKDTETKPVEETAAPKKEKKAKAKNVHKTTPPDESKTVDVSKLDLRVGYIKEISRHPDAEKLFLEQIECGDAPGNEGGFGETRTVCSGLVGSIPEDELRQRLVLVMCNLKPVKMRGITSQGMLMCASNGQKNELVDPPPGAKVGDQVTCKEYPGDPERPFLNPKKKIWETVQPDLIVDEHGVVRYKEAPLQVEGKGLLTSKTMRKCQVT